MRAPLWIGALVALGLSGAASPLRAQTTTVDALVQRPSWDMLIEPEAGTMSALDVQALTFALHANLPILETVALTGVTCVETTQEVAPVTCTLPPGGWPTSVLDVLRTGVGFSFQITARNLIGEGMASSPPVVILPAPPPPPPPEGFCRYIKPGETTVQTLTIGTHVRGTNQIKTQVLRSPILWGWGFKITYDPRTPQPGVTVLTDAECVGLP